MTDYTNWDNHALRHECEKLSKELEQANENAMVMMRRDADRLESIGKLVTKLEAQAADLEKADARIAELEYSPKITALDWVHDVVLDSAASIEDARQQIVNKTIQIAAVLSNNNEGAE